MKRVPVPVPALVPLLLAVLLALAAAAPAGATSILLHKRTSSATAVFQADSALWTLTTNANGAVAGFDTLTTSSGTINTDVMTPSVLPDTVSDRGALLGAGAGIPKRLWVTVEITGATQNIDTLTVYVQFSQGQAIFGPSSLTSVAGNIGQTNIFTGTTLGDPNAYPANWRWYDGIGVTAACTGGIAALVNNTSSKTFIFPIPAVASNANTWLEANNMRLILQSDNNATAVGIATRAWLTYR